MKLLTLLANSEFFHGISRSSIQALADISVPKNLRKREILFTEGRKGHSIYILGTGCVQLYKNSADGKEIAIKLIRPGEIFGEVILFEQDTYPVSARARENALAFLIPKHQILCLFQNERFRNDFMRMLMKKQRYLTEKILALSSQGVSGRLFRFLEEQQGRREQYPVTLSKKDVATAIGVEPETLSRVLHRLRKRNTLRWKDDRIILEKGFWDQYGK
jgi:CRP-like cAMP-binding protein